MKVYGGRKIRMIGWVEKYIQVGVAGREYGEFFAGLIHLAGFLFGFWGL